MGTGLRAGVRGGEWSHDQSDEGAKCCEVASVGQGGGKLGCCQSGCLPQMVPFSLPNSRGYLTNLRAGGEGGGGVQGQGLAGSKQVSYGLAAEVTGQLGLRALRGARAHYDASCAGQARPGAWPRGGGSGPAALRGALPRRGGSNYDVAEQALEAVDSCAGAEGGLPLQGVLALGCGPALQGCLRVLRLLLPCCSVPLRPSLRRGGSSRCRSSCGGAAAHAARAAAEVAAAAGQARLLAAHAGHAHVKVWLVVLLRSRSQGWWRAISARWIRKLQAARRPLVITEATNVAARPPCALTGGPCPSAHAGSRPSGAHLRRQRLLRRQRSVRG